MNSSAYLKSNHCPSVTDFMLLREKVGWGNISKELAQKSLANSLFHIVITTQNNIVAMGRILGDGAMYYYIQDVIVDPEYQKQGLGHMLMKEIEKYLLKHAKLGATISLLAAKGKEDFYQHYGYIPRPNDDLGNGMCKFIKS